MIRQKIPCLDMRPDLGRAMIQYSFRYRRLFCPKPEARKRNISSSLTPTPQGFGFTRLGVSGRISTVPTPVSEVSTSMSSDVPGSFQPPQEKRFPNRSNRPDQFPPDDNQPIIATRVPGSYTAVHVCSIFSNGLLGMLRISDGEPHPQISSSFRSDAVLAVRLHQCPLRTFRRQVSPHFRYPTTLHCPSQRPRRLPLSSATP